MDQERKVYKFISTPKLGEESFHWISKKSWNHVLGILLTRLVMTFSQNFQLQVDLLTTMSEWKKPHWAKEDAHITSGE